MVRRDEPADPVATALRDVARDDAAELAAVHVAAWQAAYRGLMPDRFLNGITVERWEERWAARLAGESLPPVRVAVRAGAIVGFCTVSTPSRDVDVGDGVAELVALNVAPGAWRSGVGTALMTDALARFRRDGWRVATLWVVEGNARAQAFYRRHGFVGDGAAMTHAPSGATELRMRRSLAAVGE